MEVRKRAEIDVDYASYMLGARINRRAREARAQALENSKANTEQQVAAANAKTDGDVKLEQLKHQNKMEELHTTQKNQQELEILKGINIIKAEIAKSLMAQPTATWKDLPPIIMDGMGIVDQSEKQTMIHAIHAQEDQDALQQQQMEQAQQQQQMPPQGQPQPDPNQQQVAA
jgi:ABC-type lipopolysaccharide export system ATPase subunit